MWPLIMKYFRNFIMSASMATICAIWQISVNYERIEIDAIIITIPLIKLNDNLTISLCCDPFQKIRM